jgi:uncharacterized protein YbbK (DUF523 family)
MEKGRRTRPLLGISRCLTGDITRYDARPRKAPLVLEALGEHFELLPICPEVEAGLPTPREPIRLEGAPLSPRAVGAGSRIDYTPMLESWNVRALKRLVREPELCGFVFKAGSPSCAAIRRVPLFDRYGACVGESFGLFARRVHAAFPEMPFADEQTLSMAATREAFVASCLDHHAHKAA